MKTEQNKSLINLNSFGLDVKSRWYAEPFDEDSVIEILSDKAFKNERVLITGTGSNILYSKDFDGLLIHPAIMDISITSESDEFIFLCAGAGVIWDDFVEYCVDRGWGGLENLSWIPGSVGASPVQNIGAYGTELSDCVHEVHFVDIETCKKRVFNRDECKFGYRESIFKKELSSGAVITYVTFRLSKFPVINRSYKELDIHLSDISDPSVRDVRRVVIDIRKSKLPDPQEIGNAGSFFKNPVVSAGFASDLKKIHPSLTLYETGKGMFKIPAAWLIEQCGFKGIRAGNAGTHSKHALVLVAYKGATGEDILNLAERIAFEVKNRFGISIEPEVNIV